MHGNCLAIFETISKRGRCIDDGLSRKSAALPDVPLMSFTMSLLLFATFESKTPRSDAMSRRSNCLFQYSLTRL
jgi:hypothetical protein